MYKIYLIKYIVSVLCFGLLILPLSAQVQEGASKTSYVIHRKIDEKGKGKLDSRYTDIDLQILGQESFTRNDSLIVHFQVLVSGNVVKKNEALSLIPEYQRGTDAYELPAILINGKRRLPYYKREQNLATPETYWKYKPYTSIIARKNKTQQIDYDYALPLPASEQKGKLLLKYLKQDCCDLALVRTDSLLLVSKAYTRCKEKLKLLEVAYPKYGENSQIKSYPYYPEGAKYAQYSDKVTYLEPALEQEKRRKEKLVLHINYPVDKAKVLPHFSDNAEKLQKVDSLFEHFFTDGYKFQSGAIMGYASPEASIAYNLALSERRAVGFRDYLMGKYGYLRDFYLSTKGKGEDWNGLAKAVAKTSMKDKNKIIDIIKNYPPAQGRMKKIIKVVGYDTYNDMLETLFPSLRRIELTVTYKVRSFSTDEASTMWQERPQDLSQRELYKVASATNDGRPIEIAANYFPDDITANINASSVALINGDLNKAYEYLQKVWTEPMAFNNIGVYYMLTKDYQQARVFFEKALPIDKVKAQANLNNLNKIEQ